ncbi:uncharacterized protein LOC118204232 [Stegodyphus dumicola]|uniref:uncharacterized protein LOC118204232 n=1 Tax=Stegodyphus dumicola TaxID=202533 RepID=UPI0015A7889B|nr:uncharacterized protein LOC118204232 [Stegodyphus dumicola]
MNRMPAHIILAVGCFFAVGHNLSNGLDTYRELNLQRTSKYLNQEPSTQNIANRYEHDSLILSNITLSFEEQDAKRMKKSPKTMKETGSTKVIYGFIGKSVELNCTAGPFCDQLTALVWTKEDQSQNPIHRLVFSYSFHPKLPSLIGEKYRERIDFAFSNYYARLKLHHLTAKDEGIYTCEFYSLVNPQNCSYFSPFVKLYVLKPGQKIPFREESEILTKNEFSKKNLVEKMASSSPRRFLFWNIMFNISTIALFVLLQTSLFK